MFISKMNQIFLVHDHLFTFSFIFLIIFYIFKKLISKIVIVVPHVQILIYDFKRNKKLNCTFTIYQVTIKSKVYEKVIILSVNFNANIR